MNVLRMDGETEQRLVLLRLMHLVSPALPVGAYAWSQGLESAVELQWVHDAGSAQDWLAGVMQNGLARLELPVLLRLMQAQADEQFQHWNQWLLAARETEELYMEDAQLGAALRKILVTLDIAVPPSLRSGDISFVTAFALAGHSFNIAPATLAMGLAWSWLENQVAAAVKLLDALMPQLAALPTLAAQLGDDDIGATLPGVVMASSFHQTQYSRLFRS